MSVLIETTIGTFTVDLEVNLAPKASLNFIKLCQMKYYNLCVFHRVEKHFIAQSGDPTGSGCGGESFTSLMLSNRIKNSSANINSSTDRYFEDEFHPQLSHSTKGTLSMANDGRLNRNGSQFFLTLKDHLDYLDGKYTVFGKISEGIDIVDRLNELIVDADKRPFEDIIITHTFVLDDPFGNFGGYAIPEPPPSSPIPSVEQIKKLRIGIFKEIEQERNLTQEERKKKQEEQDARTQALTLEILGDLPFYDIAPPENVLFVCKLNYVTRDEDLSLIFSRFGSIKNCEIVKDKRTKKSLGYGFIEFENPKSCEEAFLKMENVLIDDKRIHVDFSQSVVKYSKLF